MSEGRQRNKNFTIPNAISVVRILLVPFIAYHFMKDHLLTAVILIAISGLSDLFDGMIARKFDQVTELGKMLDPLADKITQGVVALCFAVKYPHIRMILLVFIVKELLMLVFAIVLLKKKKRPSAAMWYGKVATTLFYISVASIVVMSAFFTNEPTLFGITISPELFNIIANTLLALTAAFMLYSAYKYFRIFLEIMRSDDEKYSFDLPDEIRAKKEIASKSGKK